MEFTMMYPKAMPRFCKRFGLNAYYAGKHWAMRKADADEMHATVHAELYRQHIPKSIFQHPVKITFYWNDRLDVDNHAVLEKYVIDALKGWLLQDDSRKFLRERDTRFHDAPYIRVVIEEI